MTANCDFADKETDADSHTWQQGTRSAGTRPLSTINADNKTDTTAMSAFQLGNLRFMKKHGKRGKTKSDSSATCKGSFLLGCSCYL